MPADRKTPKSLFICDHPGCFRAFVRKHDRKRHKDSHLPYEERRYACAIEGCTFRANQAGGLKSHMNTRWHKSHTEAEIDDAAASGSEPSHTLRGASPAPLLWVNYTPESTPYKTSQSEHQMAHDANPVAVQVRAVSPRPPRVPAQREHTMPPFDQPLDPGMVQGTSSVSSEPCRYRDRMDRQLLTLPPLREPQWERMEVEREAPSFSYSRTRHVPSSSSSEYPRPNPRMLF